MDAQSLLAQFVAALGAALIAGNGYALYAARKGKRPAKAEGELRRGRAWFLIAIGVVILVWGVATLTVL